MESASCPHLLPRTLMELELGILLLLCLVSFTAGYLDSIAGGGGLVMLPAFLLCGVPADLALGTNKLTASLGTGASLLTYARSGLVIWRMAGVGLPVAFAGAFVGSQLLLLLDSAAIGKVVVFLLPLGILGTLLPKNVRASERELTSRDLYIRLPLVCAVVSLYEGFFGPGSASFFILAFHAFLGIGLVKAVASSKIFNFTAGISSVAVYALHGRILWLEAVPLALAAILGGVVGSRMAIRSGAGFIRKILALSLTLLFISLLWKFVLN